MSGLHRLCGEPMDQCRPDGAARHNDFGSSGRILAKKADLNQYKARWGGWLHVCFGHRKEPSQGSDNDEDHGHVGEDQNATFCYSI